MDGAILYMHYVNSIASHYSMGLVPIAVHQTSEKKVLCLFMLGRVSFLVSV